MGAIGQEGLRVVDLVLVAIFQLNHLYKKNWTAQYVLGSLIRDLLLSIKGETIFKGVF